jgi:short-subunit dehydrogenase
MANSEFQGKHALVTGGGSGIGRALALALAREGADLSITDIDQQRIDQVLAELSALGVRAEGYRVDHADEQSTVGFCNALLARSGGVDLICANAGIGDASTLLGGDMARWQSVLQVNVMGVAYTLHHLVPSMIERGGGQILITASGAGLVPGPGMSIYHASKAAACSLGASLNCELEPHGIQVSVLCPGIIKTAIIATTSFDIGSEKENEAAAKDAADLYQSGRAVEPEVVARDALRGLRRKKLIILSPWRHVGYGWMLNRLSPQWFNRLFAIPAWRKGETVGGIKVKQA